MIRPYADKIQYLYKPAYKDNVLHYVAFATQGECWTYLYNRESCGLDREYQPTQRELKKDGWTVEKYKLVKI